jgi:isoamylase
LLWSEWNGKYRDTVRDFWRGDDSRLAEFAYRFTGSSDLYQSNGRNPSASINFVTAHDGFTLRDLVSYNDKHNEANGEENRDGESHNRSWNCGEEGESQDPAVLTLRQQQGNNNAYCQDNEVSWVNWQLRDDDHELLNFARQLIALRRRHPVFRRRKWFQGRAIHGSGVHDIAWFNPDGGEMTEQQWNDGFAKAIAILLNGLEIAEPGERGERIMDDSFLIFFNAHYEMLEFAIPVELQQRHWQVIVDTSHPRLIETGMWYTSDKPIPVLDRSIVMLKQIG